MALELVFGISIAALLVLLLALKLDESKHFALRLLLIGFFFFLLILLSRATIDSNDYCVTFVNYTNVTAHKNNETFYSYGHHCIDNPNNTDEFFFTNVTRLFWFFVVYVFIYLVYEMFKRMGKISDDWKEKTMYKIINKRFK